MRIAFYAHRSIPIHANSLEERPLGGTETGLIRLAEVLHERGHEVTVFTSMENPPPSYPRYLHASELMLSGIFDAFVMIQGWRPAFLNVPATRQYLWTGDGFDQFSNFGLGDKRVAKRLARLFTVSNWHSDTLCERSRFPRDKATVIGNGVHLEYFDGEEERIRKRLVFTAAPYRGLELVPPMYLELKKRHPELELHVFAGLNIYDTDRPFTGRYVAEFRRLSRKLKSLPGCHLLGNIPQKQLARELMKSAVYWYPNTSFETCCIAAIEAQAAGCPVVASFNSALPQTVDEAGVLIGGNPGSVGYASEMIEAIDRLLSDDDHWTKLSNLGLERAKSQFSWVNVAERFEAALTEDGLN